MTATEVFNARSGSASARAKPGRLVVLCDFLGQPGGAEALALANAQLAAAAGWQVDLITGAAGSGMRVDGVRLHVIGVDRIRPRFQAVVATAALYNRKVRRFIEDFIGEHDRGDVVYHLHSWASALSGAVFDALAPVSNRVFIHAHDFFLSCPNGNYFDFGADRLCGEKAMSFGCCTTACSKRNQVDKLWRTARGMVVKAVFDRRLPWRVLMINEAMRGAFENDGFSSSTLAVAPNPSTAFTPAPIEAWRNRAFMFVGRLSREKGPDLACAAARAAGAPLVVVGDGEMTDELKRTYPEVEFVGWRDRQQLGEIAVHSRALLMSSRAPEPSSLALLEALGSGLPVVMSKNALMAGPVVANDCGLAVDVLDSTDFVTAIRRVADDDPLVQRLGENALRAHKSLSSSPQTWIADLIGRYETALAAS